jgi:tetratricopeptide (TPR) repeat protein
MTATRLDRACLLALVALVIAAHGASADTGVGKRLFEAGRYEAAVAALRAAVESDPSDAEAQFFLGRAHLALEQWDAAADRLEKAVALAPRQAAYHHRLGQAYGEQTREASLLGRASLALKTRQHLTEAVALDPKLVEARSDLVEFYLEAPGLLGGSVDKALDEAAALKALDERESLLAYAKIYRHQEDDAKLRAVYEQGVRKFPDLGQFLLELGYIREREGNVEGAFALFDRLASVAGWEMTGCYQVGRLAATAGHATARGAECLEAYVEHRPKEGMPPLDAAWYRLGEVYVHRGETARARAAFEQCLRLNPKHKEVRKALQSLSAKGR